MSLFDKLYPSGSAFPSSERVLPGDFLPESFSVPSGWEGFREAMNAAFFQYNQALQGMEAAGGKQFDYAQCGSDAHLSCGGTYQVRFISRDFENFNVLFDEIVEFPSSSLAAPDSNQFLSWNGSSNAFVASSFGGGTGGGGSICALADAIYNKPNSPKRDGDVSVIDVSLPPTRLQQPAVIPTSPAAATTAIGFTNLIAQINGTNQALPETQAVEQVVGTATYVGIRQEVRVDVNYLSAGQVVGFTRDVFPCNPAVGVLCSTILGEIELIQFGVGIAPDANEGCPCASELNGIKQAIQELTAETKKGQENLFTIGKVLIRGLPRSTFWVYAFTNLFDVIAGGLANVAHSVNGIARVLTFKPGDPLTFDYTPSGGFITVRDYSKLKAIDLTENVVGQGSPFNDADLLIVDVGPTDVERGEIQSIPDRRRRDIVTLTRIPLNASVIVNGDGTLRYNAGNVRYRRSKPGEPDVFSEPLFININGQVVSDPIGDATDLVLSPNAGFEFATNRLF